MSTAQVTARIIGCTNKQGVSRTGISQGQSPESSTFSRVSNGIYVTNTGVRAQRSDFPMGGMGDGGGGSMSYT